MVVVFGFTPRRRAWAFAQMALARPLLMRIPGMRFSKLMGTGRGLGFTLAPDWDRYALLTVWESEADARRFLDGSRFMRRYRRRARSVSHIILRTLSSHGAWNGRNPFLPASGGDPAGPLAILTRATIRPSRLRAFWREVAPVGARLAEADGLLGSIGIGEAPFIRQATLSIWRDLEAMRAFAYRAGDHRDVVRRTRDEGWYSEDLFARFAVVERSEIFPDGVGHP